MLKAAAAFARKNKLKQKNAQWLMMCEICKKYSVQTVPLIWSVNSI